LIGVGIDFQDDVTRIDHPMCNGDPNAILIVTPVYGGNAPEFSVTYGQEGSSAKKWYIVCDHLADVKFFNVLVIKP
jgi:hypothetical protein